jgi:transketolase
MTKQEKVWLDDEAVDELIPRDRYGNRMESGSWHIPSMLSESHGMLTLGQTLAEFVEEGRPIVVATSDLSFSNGLSVFQEKYPDNFLQMGISEQNMVSVSAGLATTGAQPYVAAFASFLALLCCEQIRTDIAYTRLPVRLIGHHSGIAFGFYGTSHHATEDIAIMRSIANMTVVTPADPAQLRAALRAYVDHPLPVYFRMGRGRDARVYDEKTEFVPGKAIVHSTGSDLTLISGGTTLHATLEAAEALRGSGLSVGVIDMHTVKPIDEEAILVAARSSRLLMSIEEHNVLGGLGSAVAEVLTTEGVGVPLFRHGIRDEYVMVGPPTHLYQEYHLDAAGIEIEARSYIERMSK